VNADTIYGVNLEGDVYQVDTTTGTATLVTTLVDRFYGDVDFLNGVLYASNVGDLNFGTIDLGSGNFTEIGAQGDHGWQGLAANPALGLLYTVDDDATGEPLLTVTPSGATTTIGDTNVKDGLADLAYDANDGVLYGIGETTELVVTLYTINTSTGAATSIGTVTTGLDSAPSIGYDNLNNTLYMASQLGFYSLDTSTGSPTLIGSGIPDFPAGLADIAAPEPGTSALIGLGLAAVSLGGLRRRGR
jgi:hypothetical protein